MKLIFLSLLFASVFANGQVGIGTATPNNNSILDLSSPNKALLLPRVADTSLVTTPAAGMVVYNQQSQSPNFHDGAKWNNLNNPEFASMYGTMTYTITGASSGGILFDNAPLAAIDFNNYSSASVVVGGGGGGGGTIQKADSVTIFKEFDGNSIVLKRVHLGGTHIQAIEINYLLPNGTKYYSIKLSDVFVTSQQNLFSEKTGKLTERYGLSAVTIGYKDWINNKSFSYNNNTKVFGFY